MQISYNEFHVSKNIRDKCEFPLSLYSSAGNVILADIRAVRTFAAKLNQFFVKQGKREKQVSAGTLNAMGLLDEIFHFAAMMYRKTKYPDAMKELMSELDANFSKEEIDKLLLQFINEFPPVEVYQNKISAEEYLSQTALDIGTETPRTNREATIEELILLHLANENPAFKPFTILFDDSNLIGNELYSETWKLTQAFFKKLPYWGTYGHDLISFLREPVAYAPDNLQKQLDYIRTHWADLLGDWIKRIFSGIDILSEEWKPEWKPGNGSSPDMSPPDYNSLLKEYERFSPDKEWMPKVVLMAKTVLVWLYQLSKKYNRSITRLDQIPDEELDLLRDRGFTGLWLIGLWERSTASRTIKQLCGNPEAAASAYSLNDYEIAQNLGGWGSLENLRTRLWQRGIRLASDMVPNHTGMDARWVVEKPDLFVQRKDNPFPQYTFNGPNLSNDGRVSVFLEDHYYSKSDCAVVFKRVDNYTGDTRYIYHGNDGTGMPWNDTAQIDFLNPQAREEVMQEILHVAKNFPIIRFDAAMVLAKKHIRRLWYPEPGHGGDISTRSEYALSNQDFDNAIPEEFWREVVDRVAVEVPDTLLLAEAFWMMEGYFTRTLGMHRVYNSAFMNMLKKEENFKYRATVKNTITFDPQVLKRFVNFMNNPDEETASAQFGKGDKYFGVCTLMITMPGLPMFGHGQIEGFEEKYGMEYMRAYKDENPDENLINRHNREIFPLLKKRYLFAGVEDFLFYDVWNQGSVNENIFAYSNKCGNEYAIVFYNNKYERAAGWIKESCPYAVKTGSGDDDKKLVTRTVAQGLDLSADDNAFIIFKEQRSGLWFIRKNSDIIEQGIYVSLNGFETQILLDIRQEHDTNGKIYELWKFLDGKGTIDLQTAWQDLHYDRLYKAFEQVLSKEFTEAIHTLTLTPKELKKSGKKRATVKSIVESYGDSLLNFYSIALEFAQAESKIAPAPAAEEKAKSARRAAKPKVVKIPSPANQLSAFKKSLTLIVNAAKQKPLAVTEIKEIIREIEEEQPEAPKIPFKQCLSATTAEQFLFEGFAEQKESVLFASVFAVLTKIAETELAERWGLARKGAEFLKDAEVSDRTTFNFLKRMFAISAQKQPTCRIAKGKDEEECERQSALAVANILVSSKDAWLISGVNEYDGIKWFNKELTDSSLFMECAHLLMKSSKSSHQLILKTYKTLSQAKEAAEYKCDDFIKQFEKAEEETQKSEEKESTSQKNSSKASAKASKDSKPTANAATAESEKKEQEK